MAHAASDFRGEDISNARLEGVIPEGVRWDSRTTWPYAWAERIQASSLQDVNGDWTVSFPLDKSASLVGAC